MPGKAPGRYIQWQVKETKLLAANPGTRFKTG